MNIGFVKEIGKCERRVPLTPSSVRRLVEHGHTVYFEHNVGAASKFDDEEYLAAGGKVSFSAPEVISRAEMLIKVGAPSEAEYGLLHSDQTVLAFFHLAVSTREAFHTLLEKKITAIGYEVVETLDGRLPVLSAISEIAGQMTVPIASHLLMTESGGRGILLGGAPGIPPAVAVILGAGIVGTWAAKAALGAGAQVIVLDNDTNKLRNILALFGNRIVTGLADRANIERMVRFADVLIGAVLIHGQKAPHLVTEDMVETMKPGSVVLDISIDQGGCVETSRPTTLSQPTFVYKGVTHYCVPNMTANIARTASYALSNASLPYILKIADLGVEQALNQNLDMAKGVYTYRGQCTNQVIAEIFSVAHVGLYSLVGETIWS